MNDMPLADFLAQLRQQLSEAEQKASGQPLKLSVKEIDVELKVGVKHEGGGKFSFNVWALDAEANGKVARETGHTIRLKLDAGVQGADGTRTPLDVSDEDDLS